MIDKLDDSEEFFIWVKRCFDFLRVQGGFHVCEFLDSRDGILVSFYSFRKKKKVTIIEEYLSPDSYHGLDFWVETKGLLGLFKKRKKIEDYFGSNTQVESIRQLAKMVQNHEGLMKELLI